MGWGHLAYRDTTPQIGRAYALRRVRCCAGWWLCRPSPGGAAAGAEMRPRSPGAGCARSGHVLVVQRYRIRSVARVFKALDERLRALTVPTVSRRQVAPRGDGTQIRDIQIIVADLVNFCRVTPVMVN